MASSLYVERTPFALSLFFHTLTVPLAPCTSRACVSLCALVCMHVCVVDCSRVLLRSTTTVESVSKCERDREEKGESESARTHASAVVRTYGFGKTSMNAGRH